MTAIPMHWRGRRIFVEADMDLSVPPQPEATAPHAENTLPDSLQPVSARLGKIDFDDIVELVATCSTAFLDAMERLVSPDEASIEFGVKVAGELGVPILTKVSSEGTIKVTVKWKKEGKSGKASE